MDYSYIMFSGHTFPSGVTAMLVRCISTGDTGSCLCCNFAQAASWFFQQVYSVFLTVLLMFPPHWRSICLLFVSWQSDHFWLRYNKFYIWPWKFKVKVMAKVKTNGHIWTLEFNRYVCFSFRGNRTIFGWDIANSTFDLENSRPRSWPRSKPMVTFEP